MAHLRLSTFFEAYDKQDAEVMRTWVEQCLLTQPQMLVEVFCACVEDPDESVAVDFMLNQISTDDQWALAVHLFKQKKGTYFSSLLPKLCDEHSPFSFGCVDYILLEGVNTQNLTLLHSIIPHIGKSSQCDWEDAYAPDEVHDTWKTAMDKAVEKGWFDVVKTLLPHSTEDSRFIPALTAVEWQRKDYLEYIFEHSSFDFSVGVALFSIGMPKCKNMSRYILNTHPKIVTSERFLTTVEQWDNESDKQWVNKYIAQKQRKHISSAVKNISSASSVSRKM